MRAVAELDFLSRLAVGGESISAGASVDGVDQVTRRGEQDGVQSGRALGSPCSVRLIEAGGGVADVDALVVGVVRDRGRITVTQGKRRGCLGVVRAAVGVSEPRDVGEGRSTVLAQDAAGADRGQLLIVADQADGSTTADHSIDSRGEVEGAGHAGLVDDEERVLVDRVRTTRERQCRS